MPSTVTKTCEFCEESYEVERRKAETSRFCSLVHKNLAARGDWGTCGVCEKPVPPGRKFCSPEHYREGTRESGRRARRDSGIRRGVWVSLPCASGADCLRAVEGVPPVVERRKRDVRPAGVFCSRGCYLAGRKREGSSGGGRPGEPIGTRRSDADGYVRVKVLLPSGRRGWKAEHVLVMEGILGRPLLPGENVHHKRPHSKDDNRPENLELWLRSQPAGQRVEDAVAWAREILARYDGLA